MIMSIGISFLKILEDMGFGSTWISWIRFCISNVKSLIINGKAEGFFQLYRGLMQGNTMSPFLFLITMEGLNHMFRKAKTNGWIKGFSPQTGGGENLVISHLFYANDALIFCEAELL